MQETLVSYCYLRQHGIPYSRVHLARLMRAGRFPAAVQISANRIGWRLSDLEAWKTSRPTARSIRTSAIWISPTPRSKTISPKNTDGRSGPLVTVDGRTREAALLRRVRADLTAHVGGKPTAIERALIERAAVLSLRLAQIDGKIIAGRGLTADDTKLALAWNNALRRTLTTLGGQSVKPADPLAALRAHVAARSQDGSPTA